MAKILIVEDETNIRETLRDILESQGYEVVEAKNGLIGSFKAIQDKPDLIICDINMPQMNGFEMLEVLNNIKEDLSPPFIFLTAVVDRKDVRKGMNLGADDYITKPFMVKELTETIKAKLKKRQEVEDTLSLKERKKLSNLLHDNTQQLMMASLMGLERIKTKLDVLDPDIQSIFSTSIELLRQATTELRNYSHAISYDVLIIDIASKLKSLSDSLEASSGITFKTICAITKNMEATVQTHLYRMVQESVNNILKHAHATHVTIQLESNENSIRLLIEDDGAGFDQSVITHGFGLSSLHKRAEELDGILTITSSIGKGTSIALLIDLIDENSM
jgi:two-component system alkaline phosphatase synthesis response regulator PhoP